MTCIPKHQVCDWKIDCFDGSDELETNCNFSKILKSVPTDNFDVDVSKKFFPDNKRCTLQYTSLHHMISRPQTPFNHLKGCSYNKKCGCGEYKCNDLNYCIAVQQVCDGKNDCLKGDDESNCRVFRPRGYFKCGRDDVFIRITNVCDKQLDCYNGQDELYCSNYACPSHCNCYSLTLTCTKLESFANAIPKFAFKSLYIEENIKEIPTSDEINYSITLFCAKSGFIDWTLISDLKKFPNIKILQIMNMKVKNDKFVNFYLPRKLFHLKLSRNSIKSFHSDFLSNQEQLQTLDLSRNNLNELQSNLLKSLGKLRELNIEHNLLINIQEILNELSSLIVLNMTSASIEAEPFKIIDLINMTFLELVQTGNYYECCIIKRQKMNVDCKWKKKSMNSCMNLIDSILWEIFIYLILSMNLVFFTVEIFLKVCSTNRKFNDKLEIFSIALG